eukprot:CAMPEP_0172696688 /NCGR_PEP_ID=MMETSP1074-20121228/28231_1 /TAXON_ID=2916 /ORGANISM="Ceratium fusus, Strain PA161109" /LENGTH=46 /DNA_ID= /DNA_START= /DNA_END= /DNA_ORIENTATION=
MIINDAFLVDHTCIDAGLTSKNYTMLTEKFWDQAEDCWCAGMRFYK